MDPRVIPPHPIQKLTYTLLILVFTLSLAASPAATPQAWASADGGPSPFPMDMSRTYKAASQPMLAPGEVLTYTIHLQIPATVPMTATVVDPVPLPLNYVAGSVSAGGVYDSNTRVITWASVNIPPDTPVDLTFQVTPAITVTMPQMVANVARIHIGQIAFDRKAMITLVPEQPIPHPDLFQSFKSASRWVLPPGESLTYTIHLRNTGSSPALADVTDVVPAQLAYTDGSVTGGGIYDSATKTLTWTGISVPPTSVVNLSFDVTPANTVSRPTPVINDAVISTTTGVLHRQAWIVLLPASPNPAPGLAGSHKTGSERILPPGDVLTYTIYLHNSAAINVLPVDVTDPIPTELAYLPGSASDGGVYDPGTHTLTWKDIPVGTGRGEKLTFQVQQAVTVTAPTLITNTATIQSGSLTIQRRAHTWLVPQAPVIDTIPPEVHRVVIDEQDVLGTPQVTLHISATDNIAVQWMMVKEWVLSTTPRPHWQASKSTGWIPYQADYPMTLQNIPGTHFVGVWVADAAKNHSHFDRQAMDYASLVLPDTPINQYGLQPYLVSYQAGVDVSAVATPTSGDVDLYVWYPGNFGAPDQASAETGSTPETVAFNTPTAGTYIFLIVGSTQAVYNLSITPGGGPDSMLGGTPGMLPATLSASVTSQSAASDIAEEPVLSISGVDPLENVDEPTGPFVLYLPGIRK
jgi:uncharacterized repeat protein (TIGR01451 family)